MLKTDSIVIDGATYTVQQLPCMRGLKLFARVSAALGPGLARGASAAQGMKLAGLLEVDVSQLGGAIEALAEKVTEQEIEHVTKELLYVLQKDGKDITKTFDIEMAGSITTVFKLLRFAFEVNYGDFFGALGKMFKSGAVPAKNPSSLQALNT